MASIPYETATSGDRALVEVQRMLGKFGCQSFGTMTDAERCLTIVQFKWRDTTEAIAEMNWQAGMFEGEGSIRINKVTRRNCGNLLVDLANTDESIVRRYQQMWGGVVIAKPAEGNRRPHWRWRASSQMARDFLLAMWPCLLTDKYRRRAVLAIDFQAQKRSDRANRTPEYRARQLEFYERMKALNIRGTCPRADNWRKR